MWVCFGKREWGRKRERVEGEGEKVFFLAMLAFLKRALARGLLFDMRQGQWGPQWSATGGDSEVR